MSNDIEAIIISVSHGGLVVIGPTPVIDGSELSLLSISTLMPSENRHEADRDTLREIVAAEGNQGR